MSYEVLRGKRVLVVEDEYLIAEDVRIALVLVGAEVIGPYGTLAAAAQACARIPAPHVAVLDVNLAGERVFPVAERLVDSGVPCLFTTGYDDISIPDVFARCPRLRKPAGLRVMLDALVTLMTTSP
ncbi:response regulator [Dyella sp. KRB-257]|uniref:response regulator n=1 Tax=Dyella sp. KRB-257 TaxID=3400915 RepID=UPI003C0C3912